MTISTWWPASPKQGTTRDSSPCCTCLGCGVIFCKCDSLWLSFSSNEWSLSSLFSVSRLLIVYNVMMQM